MTRPPVVLPTAAVGSVLRAVSLEVARRTWRGTSEKDLQLAMAAMLGGELPAALVPYRFEREYVLDDASRVDFALVLEDGPADTSPHLIALEMKVAGGVTEVASQIQRYAGHPLVAAVLFASTSPRLVYGMPKALRGKPVLGVIMRRM